MPLIGTVVSIRSRRIGREKRGKLCEPCRKGDVSIRSRRIGREKPMSGAVNALLDGVSIRSRRIGREKRQRRPQAAHHPVSIRSRRIGREKPRYRTGRHRRLRFNPLPPHRTGETGRIPENQR